MLKLISNGSNPEFGKFFNTTIIPLWYHLSMLPWAGSPKSHPGACGGVGGDLHALTPELSYQPLSEHSSSTAQQFQGGRKTVRHSQ